VAQAARHLNPPVDSVRRSKVRAAKTHLQICVICEICGYFPFPSPLFKSVIISPCFAVFEDLDNLRRLMGEKQFLPQLLAAEDAH
jgi:hypothetical protein